MSSKKGKIKKNKNLLELVMIVKNSGQEIIPMLESAKKWIDHWTILDTGSTDDTMQNITTCLKGIPGNYTMVRVYTMILLLIFQPLETALST